MNKIQFAELMAYVTTYFDKPLSKERTTVYYDDLRDIPLDVFKLAVKKACSEHGYPSIPLPSEFRQAAASIIAAELFLTVGEAWGIARRVASKVDPAHKGTWLVVRGGVTKTYDSQLAAAMDGVPTVVAEVIGAIGVRALCDDQESVVRGQFMKIFESVAEKRRRLAILPTSLRREIESKGGVLPAPVVSALGQIGVEA